MIRMNTVILDAMIGTVKMKKINAVLFNFLEYLS